MSRKKKKKKKEKRRSSTADRARIPTNSSEKVDSRKGGAHPPFEGSTN